jgi:hypothetical protein
VYYHPIKKWVQEVRFRRHILGEANEYNVPIRIKWRMAPILQEADSKRVNFVSREVYLNVYNDVNMQCFEIDFNDLARRGVIRYGDI